MRMRIYMDTKQEQELKAFVIADLHFSGKKEIQALKWIIKMISNRAFDTLFFVGDILDDTGILRNDKKMTDILLDFFQYLGQVIPTYLVYASHDQTYYSEKKTWHQDEETLKYQFLNKISAYKGIYILENQTKEIKPGYTISGIIPSLKYAISKPDGDPELLIRESENYHFLKDLKNTEENILLCHYPLAIEDLKYQTDLLDKVNVSFAGNTHNGMTQLRIFPLELLLNLLGEPNRGLITPAKIIKFANTANLRGITKFDDDTNLIITPAITSLAACTEFLHYFNWMFYKGYIDFHYTHEKKKMFAKKG